MPLSVSVSVSHAHSHAHAHTPPAVSCVTQYVGVHEKTEFQSQQWPSATSSLSLSLLRSMKPQYITHRVVVGTEEGNTKGSGRELHTGILSSGGQ